MSNERKKGPYGCKCQTLAHKLVGDGCDECQPMGDAQGGVPCMDPTCDCCRVHTAKEREMEARIRELEEECNLHVADFHETAAEMFRYRGALEEIDNLPSHRNPCCPTNPAKSIARHALEGSDE